MNSGSDAKASTANGMPAVLPYLRSSNSLSISTPRKPDGRTVSIAPSSSPLPPHIGLRSVLPTHSFITHANTNNNNATLAGSARRTIEAHDDPLLVSLAQSDASVVRSVAESYYSQLRDSQAENQQLRAALQQHEADSVQVVQFLEGKLKEMQTEAAAYKNGMTQLLSDHRVAEESLQLRYGDMVRERDAELTRYAAVTAKLHDDLQQASRYIQQRQEHATELQQLQEQLADLAASHEKELAALHFQTVDRKLKLIALEKTMRAEFDALVEARANKALEARFQAVLERTRNLESEKLSLTHNLQDLMQLTSQLDAERQQIRREAAVQQQAQKELKSHALARGRLKEQADMKAYQLEERLREATARHKRQMAETTARYEARVAALEEELTATRNSLQQHRTELQQMRQLTAKVVGERSELENFFHTALADCQRYRHTMHGGGGAASGAAAATTSHAHAATLTGSSRGGTTTEKVDWGGGSSAHLAAAAGSSAALMSTTFASSAGAAVSLKNNGAFFEDLPWKDKEKVIKSLLFFLNANYYKSSPAPEAVASE